MKITRPLESLGIRLGLSIMRERKRFSLDEILVEEHVVFQTPILGRDSKARYHTILSPVSAAV